MASVAEEAGDTKNGTPAIGWPAYVLKGRLTLGYTQDQLARALHTTGTSVRNWERGRTTPVAFFRHALRLLFATTEG